MESKQPEPSVAGAILSLVPTIPDVTKEDAKNIVSAILLLLDEICIEGEHEEQFCKWVRKAAKSWCETLGEHQWIHDHCGFWGHKYCFTCQIPKYPEIPGSCNECRDLLKITEEEYISRTKDLVSSQCPTLDRDELTDLLGRSQIFTKEKRIEVAFSNNKDAYRFRDLIRAIRKTAKLSQ